MRNSYTKNDIARRLWFLTWLTFSAGALALMLWESGVENIGIFVLVAIVSFIGSLPALLLLILASSFIDLPSPDGSQKLIRLVFVLLMICSGYGSVIYLVDGGRGSLEPAAITIVVLFACNCISVLLNLTPLKIYCYNNSALSTISTRQDPPLYNLSLNQNTAKWNTTHTKHRKQTCMKQTDQIRS